MPTKQYTRFTKRFVDHMGEYRSWEMFAQHYKLAKQRFRIKKNGIEPRTGKQKYRTVGLSLGHEQAVVYAWNKVRNRYLKGLLKMTGVDMEMPEEKDVDKSVDASAEEMQWRRLWTAARGRTSNLKEENDWVAENAYTKPEDIMMTRIPSPQAVNSLRWLQSSDSNLAEFFKRRTGSGTSKTALDADGTRVQEEALVVDDTTTSLLNTIGRIQKAGKQT